MMHFCSDELGLIMSILNNIDYDFIILKFKTFIIKNFMYWKVVNCFFKSQTDINSDRYSKLINLLFV